MTRSTYISEKKPNHHLCQKETHIAINSKMIEVYWLIGKRIVEEEQKDKQWMKYGREVIKNLSDELQGEFGKGFAERCLREYRQFYTNYMVFEFTHNVRQILNEQLIINKLENKDGYFIVRFK